VNRGDNISYDIIPRSPLFGDITLSSSHSLE